MRPIHSRGGSPRRMKWSRSVALAAVLCAPLAASVAVAERDAAMGDPAIPPGEEELIASMLGRGTTLHDCTLLSADVEYDVIKATYGCLGGEVTLALGHPTEATPTSTQTGQFAITVESGSPPPGFADALVPLVRAREGDFQWNWPQAEAGAEDDDGGE
jgi:hypothetical protein